MSSSLLEDIIGQAMDFDLQRQPKESPGMFGEIPQDLPQRLPGMAASYAGERFRDIGSRAAESNRASHQLFQDYREGRNPSAESLMDEVIAYSPGAMGGMIKPRTWKLYSPEAKTVMTQFANKQPEQFKKVLEHPIDLMTEVLPPPQMGRNLGTYQVFHPMKLRNPHNPKVERDFSKDIIKIRDDVVKDPAIMGHEVGHKLQRDRVINTSPEDAATIGMLMDDLLPARSKSSLSQAISNYWNAIKDDPFAMMSGTPKQYLKALKTDKPISVRKGDIGGHYSPDWMSSADHYSRLMMDEGLAHLKDTTMGQLSTAKLRKLARDLGVAVDNPSRGWADVADVAKRLDPQGWDKVGGKLDTIIKSKGPDEQARVWQIIRQLYNENKGPAMAGKSDDLVSLNPRNKQLTPDELKMYDKMSPEHRSSLRADIPRKPHNPESKKIFDELMRKIDWNQELTKKGKEGQSVGMASYDKFRGMLKEEEIPEIMKRLREEYTESFPPEYLRRVRDSLTDTFGTVSAGPETADKFISELMGDALQSVGALSSKQLVPGRPLSHLRVAASTRARESFGDKASLNPKELGAVLKTLMGRGALERLAEEAINKGNPVFLRESGLPRGAVIRSQEPPSQSPEKIRANLRKLQNFLETIMDKEKK